MLQQLPVVGGHVCTVRCLLTLAGCVFVWLQVSLRTLQLQPNGPARSLVLPLHKAQNSRASVQLTLQWLKSTKPVQKRQPRNTFGQRAVVQQDAGVLPAQQVEPAVEADERLSASSRTLPAANKNVSWHDKVGAATDECACAERIACGASIDSGKRYEQPAWVSDVAVPAQLCPALCAPSSVCLGAVERLSYLPVPCLCMLADAAARPLCSVCSKEIPAAAEIQQLGLKP